MRTTKTTLVFPRMQSTVRAAEMRQESLAPRVDAQSPAQGLGGCQYLERMAGETRLFLHGARGSLRSLVPSIADNRGNGAPLNGFMTNRIPVSASSFVTRESGLTAAFDGFDPPLRVRAFPLRPCWFLLDGALALVEERGKGKKVKD